MEQWVPLMVAVVAGVSAIGVAFWNSRGESAELRLLKGMNDVLEGLPEHADETKAFVDARNGLLVRVAARVSASPARRRLAWRIGLVGVGIGMVATGAALAIPQLQGDQAMTVVNGVTLGVSFGVLVLGIIRAARDRKHAVQVAEAQRRRTAELLDAMVRYPREDKN